MQRLAGRLVASVPRAQQQRIHFARNALAAVISSGYCVTGLSSQASHTCCYSDAAIDSVC
eukprot:6500-Heterococcus_DN1.PRE.2